jgi:hypothetical protein
MIGAVLAAPAAGLVVALAPASAGASAARAPVALTAAPARISLAGSTRAAVRVTNSGTRRVVVDVSRAGFALDLRGRPRIVPRRGGRSAAGWLTLRPSRFGLGPRASVSLAVASRVPRRAEPGDHDALVLLSTRPLGRGRVAVRVRMGVVVVVRVPGSVVRRLQLRRLRVVRGRRRALELLVANRGNVTESLEGARAVVSLTRSGRRVATLVASRRDVRPRTRGIVEFRFRGHARGRMTVRVVIPGEPGRSALRRTYRIRL